MFYYEIQWFYQDLKGENLCFLNLYSVHAARILDLSLEMLSPLKSGMKRLYNSKGFSLCRSRHNISIFRSQTHQWL